jgi:DNA-binding NtrC family response regulator/tetratricopeptide (TPR) repeat protein
MPRPPSLYRQASLVLDRFLPLGGTRGLDLATARRVTIRARRAIKSSQQTMWSDRCAALVGSRQPCSGRLLDFGLTDAGTAIEVFDAERLTPTRRRAGAVVPRQPGAGVSGTGVVAAVLEALETGSTCGPRVIRLCGPPGTAVCDLWILLAREARLRGFVPVTTSILANSAGGRQGVPAHVVNAELRARHLVVFHDEASDADRNTTLEERRLALARLVPTLAAGGRPNLVVVARRSAGDSGVSAGALQNPRTACAPARAIGGGICLPAAAEAATPYVVGDRRGNGSPHESPEIRDALAQAHDGLLLASKGRHAPGVRLMRRALGALERRQHIAEAGWTAMDLGALTLRRGEVSQAMALFERARRGFERSGSARGAVAAAIGAGLAETDADELPKAEATLRSALAVASTLDDAGLIVRARLALARCLYWQGKWHHAQHELELARGGFDGLEVPMGMASGRLLVAERGAPSGAYRREGAGGDDAWSGAADRALDVSPDVAASALACRIALASGDAAVASAESRRSADLAAQSRMSLDIWTAERAMAELQASVGDEAALRLHVARGMSAAREVHLPMLQLRLRMAFVEGLHQAGRSNECARVLRRLSRIDAERLPALMRRRLRDARDRCGTAVRCPPAGGMLMPDLVPDLIEFISLSQEIGDPRTLVEQVCTRAWTRLDAACVVLIAKSGAGLATLASVGRRLGSTEIAERAMALGERVGPIRDTLGHEAAVPIRCGDHAAALAVRWAVDRLPDSVRSAAVLAGAASALPGAVRALLYETVLRGEEAGRGQGGLLGVSKAMEDLRRLLARAAAAPFPVLIEGESGTGKELAARVIHDASARRARRFCAVNCAALGDDLLEAELFGHAKGAFTGAVAERAGLFEAADGGTLFLDEVGELSSRAQAKLLRAIQEGEIRRIGENATRSVDVRLVAATNRSLRDDVREGRFRQDLLYRLDVISVRVPALRSRAEDIPVLAAQFWEDARSRTGSRAALSSAVMAALCRYGWPGNARELQNVLAAMAVAAPPRGTVGLEALPDLLRVPQALQPPEIGTLEEARRRFEAEYVRAAIARAGGRRARAASELGLTRQGLSKMLVRLGIDAPA